MYIISRSCIFFISGIVTGIILSTIAFQLFSRCNYSSLTWYARFYDNLRNENDNAPRSFTLQSQSQQTTQSPSSIISPTSEPSSRSRTTPQYAKPHNFYNNNDYDIAKMLHKKVRILCWIMTQPKNHETKALAVNQTWAPRCNGYFFLTSNASTNGSASTLPYVEQNLTESRNNLWAKTVNAFEYIYKHFLNDYDFFLKADDDSYVIVENLRFFVANISGESLLYAGRQFKPNRLVNKKSYMSGGATYLLSRAAVRLFVEKGPKTNYSTHCTMDHYSEDVNMGICMQALNVKIYPSIDTSGTERFHPFNFESHMFFHTWPKDFWLHEFNFYPIKYMYQCCSNLSISFHYITYKDMFTIDYFVYRLRPFGIGQGCHDNNLLTHLPTKTPH